MRFLVTGVGGPAGAGVARQLSARGHEVVGVDMSPVDLPALAAFELVPAAADPGYTEETRLLVEQYRVDVLIPTVQDELPIISAVAARGNFPVPIVVGAPEPVNVAQDKYLTMLRLEAGGVSVPRFGLPSEFAGPAEALDWFGPAMVVKPRVGRGSRGVRVIRHPDELDGWPTDSHLIQEFAPGAEYAPMTHISSRNGVAQVGVVEKVAFVGCLSASDALRPLAPGEAEDIEDLVLAAARGLGLTGPVDVDVRRRSDGVPVVLEVNARFGANSEHAPQIVEGMLADLADLADLDRAEPGRSPRMETL